MYRSKEAITDYYDLEEKEEKKSFLDTKLQEKENVDTNQIRLAIWNARYGKRMKKSSDIDYFVKSFLSLVVLSRISLSFLNQKKEEKELLSIMKDLCIVPSQYFDLESFHPNQSLAKELLLNEYRNFASYYFHLCISDKTFSSALMGTVSLKEEKVMEKLASDIKTACFHTPRRFAKQDEFKELREILYSEFENQYPKYSYLLEKQD